MALRNKFFSSLVILMCVVAVMAFFPTSAFANESNTNITGKVYEFEKDAHYEISSASATNTPAIGAFSISGDFSVSGNMSDYAAYSVKSGNLAFSYEIEKSVLERPSTECHLVEDKTKTIDTVKTDENIMTGAVVLQTSLDGETWTDDSVMTNVFGENSSFGDSFYNTKDIQLQNGCYYRVIVVYKMEQQVEDTKILFVSFDNFEYKKVAEVYTFYAIGSDSGNTISAQDTPRKELGEVVNAGKDTGYSESNAIAIDDPHYGWDIGTFTVNGYTRETKDDTNNPLFLKNVGDKVTLWFTMSQDITCLNGNSNLSISEDTNGYDQYFGEVQQNFKNGALIIRYTDSEGVKHTPVVYTDYLAANAKTGADTRVQLFEEGDYEVALDYEIKNSSSNFWDILLEPINTNYSIFIKFSIRNGNCMVYPFDVDTGAELSDNSLAANGFKLDMAKSKYLTIDVTKTVLQVGSDGLITEDVRFNRPAKDGEEYTDEGIYVFDVTNLYTDQHTTKTIYVGADSLLQALSSNGLSVKELNEQIADGAIIQEDGSMTYPVATPEPETEPEIALDDKDDGTSLNLQPTQEPLASAALEEAVNPIEAPVEVVDEPETEQYLKTAWPFAGGAVVVVAVAAVVALIVVSNKKNKVSSESEGSEK